VFRQLADHLRNAILSGELGPGEKLPSERAVMDEAAVARGTVRDAVQSLRTEGLVDVEHGRGAFVRQRPPVRRVAYDRFVRRRRQGNGAVHFAGAAGEGSGAEEEVLSAGRQLVPEEIAERLRVPAHADVLVRRSRYLEDGGPVAVATSYEPCERAPWTTGEGTGRGGAGHAGDHVPRLAGEVPRLAGEVPRLAGEVPRLAGEVPRLAGEVSRLAEEVTARMPSPEEARALRLSVGVPVLVVFRTAYAKGDEPLEVCHTVMAADRFVLDYELPVR
jgi:GntR family transcriptional regulator